MAKTPTIPDDYRAGYLSRLDGRTAVAQDMQARWRILTDDLGGEAALSYSQRSLVERALWLEHWLAETEKALARGDYEAFDAARWTQACNSLLGIFNRLGLERRSKDVTPSLADYITRAAK